MNQKGFINIILVIIAVSIVGVGTYFVLSQRTTPPISSPTSPLTPTPIQNPESSSDLSPNDQARPPSTKTPAAKPIPSAQLPSPPSSANETYAAWLTYSNSQYNFQFRYPSNWTISEEAIKSQKLPLSIDVDKSASENYQLRITFSPSSFESAEKEISGEADRLGGLIKKNLTINGLRAVYVYGRESGAGTGPDEFIHLYYIELGNNRIINITFLIEPINDVTNPPSAEGVSDNFDLMVKSFTRI